MCVFAINVCKIWVINVDSTISTYKMNDIFFKISFAMNQAKDPKCPLSLIKLILKIFCLRLKKSVPNYLHTNIPEGRFSFITEATVGKSVPQVPAKE